MEILGIIVFALGILLSVCLHEAGHMVTAKAFGMKVTRYFVGFGKTLFSFRKGETEYGVKAIPLGGFVKIVGMTPQDDDVEPGDEKRAMWRFPVWKRTVVMSAGSATHFLLGFILLWGVLAFFPHNDYEKTNSSPAVVDTIIPCVKATFEVGENGQQVQCKEGTDPQSAAKTLGLRAGDKILAVDGVATPSWTAMTEKVRSAGGQTITLTYERDGKVIKSSPIELPAAERPKLSLDPNTPTSKITPNDLEKVGQLGITPQVVRETAGPIGIGLPRTIRS
jgi:membrane-associated protease RseP (regulator of RpoE activity)